MRQKKENRLNKGDKILIILLVLILIFSLFYFIEIGLIDSIDKRIKSTQENLLVLKDKISDTEAHINQTKTGIEYYKGEINSTSLQLELIEFQLEKNNTELEQLKTGNITNLYDPIYKDVTNFIEGNKYIDEDILIDKAKSQGIRCAYVLINVRNGSYRAIGFNTLDKGMVYFQIGTGNRVIPEIGKLFSDCVIDSNYYSSDDYIRDILIIW